MRAIALVLLLAASGSASAQNALVERGLADLWAAGDAEGRARAAESIVRAGADIHVVHARLRSGRPYRDDVDTGLVEESRRGVNGLRHEYVFLVPEDYDPGERYRVCVYLHGGVGRPDAWRRGDDWWRRFDRFDGDPQISVFPSSWRGSRWWQESQIENLAGILERIRRDYNVDENRVYLFGVSDGGTGAYYHAFKAPTPWAGFFAFIGHPSVLDNPATGVDGVMFSDNLVNKPLYVVNGEKDRLYPVDRVRPFVETYRSAGVDVVFRAMPGGHNTRWWNSERGAIEEFMDEHPRDPYPDRIVWETEDPRRFGRAHWLVIDELRDGARSGRVEVHRDGNVFEARSRGVRRYRLLLSPEEIDLERRVRIVTNGVVSFDGEVAPSVETLLRWAARDDDRTMLFAAERVVELGEAEP